jgi:hypothetical protein
MRLSFNGPVFLLIGALTAVAVQSHDPHPTLRRRTQGISTPETYFNSYAAPAAPSGQQGDLSSNTMTGIGAEAPAAPTAQVGAGYQQQTNANDSNNLDGRPEEIPETTPPPPDFPGTVPAPEITGMDQGGGQGTPLETATAQPGLGTATSQMTSPNLLPATGANSQTGNGLSQPMSPAASPTAASPTATSPTAGTGGQTGFGQQQQNLSPAAAPVPGTGSPANPSAIPATGTEDGQQQQYASSPADGQDPTMDPVVETRPGIPDPNAFVNSAPSPSPSVAVAISSPTAAPVTQAPTEATESYYNNRPSNNKPWENPDNREPPAPPKEESYEPPDDMFNDDPVSQEIDEDIANEWDDKNPYEIAKQEADEALHDKWVPIVASVCGVIAFFLMIFVAQQMIENPDGCCAKVCRCSVACFRIICWPCRLICCCGGSRAKARRTHAILNDTNHYGYTHDLELT